MRPDEILAVIEPEATARGFDLIAVLPGAALIAAESTFSRWSPLGALILFGSGRALWARLRHSAPHNSPDPVDDLAEEALAALIGGPLRPFGPTLRWSATMDTVPVSTIARLAGWGHATPLGLLLHPQRGTWFGIRGVVSVDSVVEGPLPSLPEHACLRCVDSPCVTACGPGALHREVGLDVGQCMSTRTVPGPCADACAARRACPIGVDARYDTDQERHHHHAGNASWLRWVGAGPVPERPKEWTPHRGEP